MTRQKSTLTLSKLNSATNVSTLELESSPKNDISLSNARIRVVAAHVLTRVRFSKDWKELTVLIPSTELNQEYWGQGIARNNVTAEAHKLGFNGRTQFLTWVTDNHQYISTR
ncbi:hypothetical protein L1D34_26590 [Vibrio mediterranei]|uniref:hypothetical protein n=1 Tax=Vibrio mediterranei TaxID=689 RepID=UPI001EFCB7B3|nr:hypothetical protein [Vibrio mediterranei]MCG9628390.1 hypothetical protein [Vibrio mediterranei]